MSETQLLVVEDIEGLRDALMRTAAEVFTGATVAGAGTLAQARAWLAAHRRVESPLIALVDLGLPDGKGDALIAELSADANAVCIVTTVFEDDGNVTRALAAGAQGYLLKSEDMEVIAQRLRGLQQGEVALSPAIARRLLSRFRDVEPASLPGQMPLSDRETEVLSIIGRGLTIAETAQVLKIGAHTVASHVKNIYRKLNIASRAEAAIEAARRGLT